MVGLPPPSPFLRQFTAEPCAVRSMALAEYPLRRSHCSNLSELGNLHHSSWANYLCADKGVACYLISWSGCLRESGYVHHAVIMQVVECMAKFSLQELAGKELVSTFRALGQLTSWHCCNGGKVFLLSLNSVAHGNFTVDVKDGFLCILQSGKEKIILH